MKKQSILIIILFFTFSAIMMSCGNGGQNTKTNSQSNEVEEKTNSQFNEVGKKTTEQPTVEISGTYSGTDNVGMESTIILRSGGSMVVQSSIGDGTPSVGRWSGDAENLSLYIESERPYYDNYGNLRMGGSQLLGRARITQEGLQIIGGNFYSRQ
ncbi:MAG: hypothetical protein FJY17_08240 [Bacteroidetes bacterium]|nr:hypothetical protein [Bacteroidota bacterium]